MERTVHHEHSWIDRSDANGLDVKPRSTDGMSSDTTHQRGLTPGNGIWMPELLRCGGGAHGRGSEGRGRGRGRGRREEAGLRLGEWGGARSAKGRVDGDAFRGSRKATCIRGDRPPVRLPSDYQAQKPAICTMRPVIDVHSRSIRPVLAT
eukprot:366196-Chlamydomonas_euryale.AAC.22